METSFAGSAINTDVDDRRRHARMLERLSDIGRTISADLELQKVVQAVTDAATELSGAQFGRSSTTS